MRPTLLRPPLPRGLAWLLWLALLLPVMQSAAVSHGLSHVARAAAAQHGDQQAPHEGYCQLCLAAATVGGGVLPGGAPLALPLALGHALPRAVVSHVWFAFLTPAYRSRAPPSGSH
ncbi:hypothetical protein [Methylibium sp.]|uniref:hypothetical protein n=1 Tax=Methylibium sp. TaxID=2067992 RepID=UPI003D0C85CA